MVGWSNRCVVYSEPVRMFGFLAIWGLSFGKTPKICKSESLNSIGKTLLKKVTGVLSSQRVCARCKCAVRRAHTKLAWKATAVQAKQHAGKSHVGSPLSSAWFASKNLKAASHQLKFACYTFWVRRKSNNLQHCIFQSHQHKVTRYIFWCIIWISRDRYIQKEVVNVVI